MNEHLLRIREIAFGEHEHVVGLGWECCIPCVRMIYPASAFSHVSPDLANYLDTDRGFLTCGVALRTLVVSSFNVILSGLGLCRGRRRVD